MMEDLVEPDPLSIKEEQEPELVQVKEEGEFLKIKEEEEEPELAQIKKEEEEPAPFHLKVEEEPEHLHVKKEEEEAEPPQKKEEEEELGISHDEEQPGQKQQADTCMQTLVFKVKDHREQEPSSICLLTENSAETENLKHEGNDDEDSGSSQADLCKDRRRTLRDAFLRHNKRIQLPSGSPESPPKDRKYQDIMSFLLPYVQPSSSKNSLCPTGGLKGERTGTPLADTEERGIMPSSSYSKPSTSGEKRSCSPTETPSRRPATKAKSTGTPMEDRIMCLLENLTPTNTHKESSHFALSTVPILTKLSSPRRRRAKREIMRILDDLTDEQEEQQRVTAST